MPLSHRLGRKNCTPAQQNLCIFNAPSLRMHLSADGAGETGQPTHRRIPEEQPWRDRVNPLPRTATNDSETASEDRSRSFCPWGKKIETLNPSTARLGFVRAWYEFMHSANAKACSGCLARSPFLEDAGKKCICTRAICFTPKTTFRGHRIRVAGLVIRAVRVVRVSDCVHTTCCLMMANTPAPEASWRTLYCSGLWGRTLVRLLGMHALPLAVMDELRKSSFSRKRSQPDKLQTTRYI